MIWLKGDVHCHSKFSDGDSSVKDILDEAKTRAQLDFLAITDHDTHFQDHPESITTWSDPSYVSSPELVLLYGIDRQRRPCRYVWSVTVLPLVSISVNGPPI